MIIKGINLDQERDWKVWVQKFVLEKLGVKDNVINVRKSGAVFYSQIGRGGQERSDEK